MTLGVLNSGRPVSLSPGFAQAQRFLPSGKKAPSSVPTSKSKGPCSEHVCSLGGSSQSSFIKALEAPTCQRSAGTAGAASSSSHAAVSADSWWKENLDVWTLVHSEAEFQNVLEGAKDKIVVVDFYATWCKGCKSVYPQLCDLAKDKDLQKTCMFVKVNLDEMKPFCKAQGITALPQVALYRSGEGKLVSFMASPAKMKFFRSNVAVVLGNPGKAFRTDPNGFVIAVEKTLAAQHDVTRAAELKALRMAKGGLQEMLEKVARGGDASTPDSNAPPGPVSEEPPAGPQPSGRDHVMELAKQILLRQGEYGYAGRIDEVYASEIAPRLPAGQHYMDYAGSSLYGTSQVANYTRDLQTHVYGNPHSANPSSELTTERVEMCRDMVMKFFNANPDEYQVVFTRSATDSLKLVGETFPWSKASEFRYLRENHNSVLGIRQYALEHGACYQSVDEAGVESWLGEGHKEPHDTHCKSKSQVKSANGNGAQPFSGNGNGASAQSENGASQKTAAHPHHHKPHYNLFSFPAEDNFAGVKYPLEWVQKVQAQSTPEEKWMVLLDAACFVPTQPLDLSVVPADFVSVSFYKIFGFPTGVGALIVRTAAVDLLKKVFWGGGTVSLATSNDDFHVLKCRPSDRLEDGTVAFLDIIGLRYGFEALQGLGGMGAVHAHVCALTRYLYLQLTSLQHSNGTPMIKVFGKHASPDWRKSQGGIVNFEILSPEGNPYSYRTFQKESAEAGFHLRTGSECNPGACYAYLGVNELEVEQLAGQKEGCDDDVEWVTVSRPDIAPATVHSSDIIPKLEAMKLELGHPSEVAMKWIRVPLGTIRASLGYMSRLEDAHALVQFINSTYKDRAEAVESSE